MSRVFEIITNAGREHLAELLQQNSRDPDDFVLMGAAVLPAHPSDPTGDHDGAWELHAVGVSRSTVTPREVLTCTMPLPLGVQDPAEVLDMLVAAAETAAPVTIPLPDLLGQRLQLVDAPPDELATARLAGELATAATDATSLDDWGAAIGALMAETVRAIRRGYDAASDDALAEGDLSALASAVVAGRPRLAPARLRERAEHILSRWPGHTDRARIGAALLVAELRRCSRGGQSIAPPTE